MDTIVGGSGNVAGRGGARETGLRILAAAALVALFAPVLLSVLLGTEAATGMVGEILSDYTGQKVTVAGIRWSGGSITLKGISVGNGPGYRERELLVVRSLTFSPDLAALFRAEMSLSRLEINGLRLNLERNAGGSWNFSGLLRRLKERKGKSGREFFIRRLALRDAAMSVNGRTLEHLGLTLDNFSTRGSTPSKLVVTARDPQGNPFSLMAEGRLGPSPAAHFSLAAPSLPLSPLAGLSPPAFPLSLDHATAGIHFSADLRGSLLAARGVVRFGGIVFRTGGNVRPVRGSIDLSGRFDAARDEIDLEHADLKLNDRITVRVTGSVERVRKDPSFALLLSHDTIDLKDLMSLLPERSFPGILLEGTLTSRGLHLEGSRAREITGGGEFSLRSVRLAVKDRPLLRGAGADLSLAGRRGGWLAKGRVFSGRGEAAVVSLDAPFTALLSSRFKPQRVELPAIAAHFLDGRLRGSFRYIHSDASRFRVECLLRDVPLPSLNRYLTGSTLRLSSGTMTAAAQLSGASTRELAGRVSATLGSPSATAGDRKVSFREAFFSSMLRLVGGRVRGDGRIKAEGGVVGGTPCGASLDFSLENRDLKVARALLTLGRNRASVASASIRLPSGGEKKDRGGIPVAASFAGFDFRSGDFSLAGLSGSVDCRYSASETGRLLYGGSSIANGVLAYRDLRAASLAGRVAFRGREAVAEIGGESLGGTITAAATVAPFSPNREASFTARLRDQRLEELSRLLPERMVLRPAGGTADAFLDGAYDRAGGFRAKVSLAGRNVSLRGAENRNIISGAEMGFAAVLGGEDILLEDGFLRWKDGPSIRTKGEVKRFTRRDRDGSIAVSMASARLNSLLDAFVNVLPGSLQEAVCEGSCALDGNLDIRGSNTLFQGRLLLENASLEIASQKVLVKGINGRVPFSLAFPWQGTDRKPSPLSYSRDNFPRLVKEAGVVPAAASRLSVDSVRFGALEVGKTTFFITADKGLTEVSRVRASLYDGTLMGSGFFMFNNGFRYGGDFLLEDLSLKRFCDSFPKIRGYLSGRVDGVISLANENGGVAGLAGYVNLWTRRGKGEDMLVSKEFLQKLAGKKLRGFLFRNDRPFDNGEIVARMRGGYLTFERLDISHTNLLGMKDLSVSVAPVQNRIAVGHLLESIREAAARGKAGGEGEAPPVQTDLKWLE